MATIIKVDGTMEEITIDKQNSLEQMQKIVGGYIEVIPIAGGKTLVVNEEGLLQQLPINHKASALYSGTIVGDVILCTLEELEDEEEGE